MKYAVCAHYCDTTILIDVFDTLEEAESFTEKPCHVASDDVVYPDEMWTEPYEDIPFADFPTAKEIKQYENMTEYLPF